MFLILYMSGKISPSDSQLNSELDFLYDDTLKTSSTVFTPVRSVIADIIAKIKSINENHAAPDRKKKMADILNMHPNLIGLIISRTTSKCIGIINKKGHIHHCDGKAAISPYEIIVKPSADFNWGSVNDRERYRLMYELRARERREHQHKTRERKMQERRERQIIAQKNRLMYENRALQRIAYENRSREREREQLAREELARTKAHERQLENRERSRERQEYSRENRDGQVSQLTRARQFNFKSQEMQRERQERRERERVTRERQRQQIEREQSQSERDRERPYSAPRENRETQDWSRERQERQRENRERQLEETPRESVRERQERARESRKRARERREREREQSQGGGYMSDTDQHGHHREHDHNHGYDGDVVVLGQCINNKGNTIAELVRHRGRNHIRHSSNSSAPVLAYITPLI